ncbi:hypothetical protein QUB63_21045 [Microcoleus sp. ARI1-B5]|uniref:hypothetical protein n=1 Tax=unclassified Microcoleus TaxID=2642155 RepID=UPI002FCF7179
METYEDIASFLYLLTKIPEIFSPAVWEDLPSLAAEIDQLAGNESAINDAIKNWCVQRELGDALIMGNQREISDPSQPLQTTLAPLENLTKTLPESIMNAYKKRLKQERENSADTSNESN